MTTIRRILCATDLSPASAPAWEEARRLGRLTGAEVVLLHVMPPLLPPPEAYLPPAIYQELLDGATRQAREEMERLAGVPGGPGSGVRTRLEEGSAASRILEAVAAEEASLLVVGTHGRTGLSHLVLGSVADRLVRQAPCPVLTVRATLETRPRDRVSRICYATDFSAPARAAWPWVVALAEATGAAVDLVHVTFVPVTDRHAPVESVTRLGEALRDSGRAEAERFLEGSALARDRIRTVVLQGSPGEQITQHVKDHGADLVVLGTHGWSGLLQWMMGSVARHVIHAAPCPVLTVGPAGHDRPGT